MKTQNFLAENLLTAVKETLAQSRSWLECTKTLTKIETALEAVVKPYFYKRRDLITSYSAPDEKTWNLVVPTDKQDEFTKKMDELSQEECELNIELPVVLKTDNDKMFSDKFHNAFLKLVGEENYKIEKPEAEVQK